MMGIIKIHFGHCVGKYGPGLLCQDRPAADRCCACFNYFQFDENKLGGLSNHASNKPITLTNGYLNDIKGMSCTHFTLFDHCFFYHLIIIDRLALQLAAEASGHVSSAAPGWTGLRPVAVV